MSTINNMISSSYSTQSKTATTSKAEIKELNQKISDANKNSALSSEERKKLVDGYKEEISAINSSLKEETDTNISSIAKSNSSLVSSMFGSTGGTQQQTGFDFFFGASASVASLKAVNSARLNIENRARTLTAEIAMDKLRGISTTGKQETLANLTSNLTLMDGNLSKNVDSALDTTKKSSEPYTPIIDKIKNELDSTQKKLDKEFEGYDPLDKKKYEKTDSEAKTESDS